MKPIVLTTEQLVRMTALDHPHNSEVRVGSNYVFPAKYEYLRPLFETEQYLSYWSTGENFWSPRANDLDFGYSFTSSRNIILNQIKGWIAAKAYTVTLHWRALKNAYDLALSNTEVYIPTLDELIEAWFAEFSQLEQEMYA